MSRRIVDRSYKPHTVDYNLRGSFVECVGNVIENIIIVYKNLERASENRSTPGRSVVQKKKGSRECRNGSWSEKAKRTFSSRP